MFCILLADVCIGIDNRYDFIEKQCKDYICRNADPAFTVSVTQEEILEEQQNGSFSPGYCESICLYRHICEEIAAYDVFLLHSSVVEVAGKAYAFAAKSGVGKSTHTVLWLENIPGARVLNGDKPLYRLQPDGSFTVYGTPWNGKENWGINASAPLSGICFLERGKVNTIRPMSGDEATDRLLHQLYLRGERFSLTKRLMMMDAMIQTVPFYLLSCNISPEAALVCYEGMKK